MRHRQRAVTVRARSVICLLPNCCFLSELSRMLEIDRALRARGAPVRIATHGGTYEWLLDAAGVAYDVIAPRTSAERCESVVRSVPGIGPPHVSMWSDQELRAYAEAEAAYFRDRDARAVVTGWTLTALLSSRLAQIPLVTEHAGSWVPPMFERGLLPLPSAHELPHMGWLPRPVRRRLYNARLSRRTGYIAGFNRVADELGVEGIPSFPALLLGDLTLVTDVPEMLGIPRAELDGWVPRRPASYRPGTHLRYAGPMYAKFAIPTPPRVHRYLAQPGPVIYVALCSSPVELVTEVVARLRSLDARILVSAAGHDLGRLEDEQVMAESLLPNHEVMPRVDLAVITGGQGSVQTALASGVPLLGIPLQAEQDLNVWLAERQGAARLVAQPQAVTPTLTRVAAKMLADDRYRRSAARIRQIFAAVDGPGAAADAIIELAGSRPAAETPRAASSHSV